MPGGVWRDGRVGGGSGCTAIRQYSSDLADHHDHQIQPRNQQNTLLTTIEKVIP